MKTLLAVVALSTLVGCTTYYVKPGGTQTEWERDKYVCGQQAQQLRATMWSAHMETNWDLYNQCIAAHGWRKTKATRSPVAPEPSPDDPYL